MKNIKLDYLHHCQRSTEGNTKGIIFNIDKYSYKDRFKCSITMNKQKEQPTSATLDWQNHNDIWW